MKKTLFGIAIILCLIFLITVSINNNNFDEDNNNQQETNYTPETNLQPESSNNKNELVSVKISSDEYFDILYNTVQNNVEPNGYVISRISTLRTPYYTVECTASNIDATNFKNETLKIAENIYNILLEYEYKRPNIFVQSHEIVSLSFEVVANGETTNTLCIQFDLTDIDKTKSFLENLKTPITTDE